MASANIFQRGDQTLVGDHFLVDMSASVFKVYQKVANPEYPDNSTEDMIWVQTGPEYSSRQDALIAAVNLASTVQ